MRSCVLRFVAGLSGILPFKQLAQNPNLKTRADVPSSCASTVTPACLQALYGIPITPATHSSNVLGVSGFIDEWVGNTDLEASVLLVDCPSIFNIVF